MYYHYSITLNYKCLYFLNHLSIKKILRMKIFNIIFRLIKLQVESGCWKIKIIKNFKNKIKFFTLVLFIFHKYVLLSVF